MKHGETDWNPFIEPSDDMRRLKGRLTEIDCGKTTTIRVEASGRRSRLPSLIYSTSRCVTHPPSSLAGRRIQPDVIVDYARTPNAATAGIVRGMTF